MDLADALRHDNVNYRGALHTLAATLPHLLAQASGHVSLVSSVAGLTGLPQSLAYGPTKAALINLAESLYLDLHPKGIGVSLVLPGFVKTRLTAQNDFEMPDLISPEQAAQHILQGWHRGQFRIAFPPRFSRLMRLLALLPDRIRFPLIHRITGL